MNWGEFGLILGSVGGFELIKWIFTRKSSKRVEKAQADDAEYESYQKQIDRYEERLADKDRIIAEKDAQLIDKERKYHDISDKYHEQTLLLREVQAKLLKKEEECGDKKAKISELLAERKMKLCERKGCGQRIPQSGY